MESTEIKRGFFTGAEEVHPAEGTRVGGSLAETIAGAGAIVLSILGLVGILPDALLGVATIAIGGAFLMASGSIVSRLNELLTHVAGTTLDTGELAVGMTTEFMGGIAGIALGVLSLLGLVPNILLPVAAMAFGFTLLFGARAQSRISELEMQCNAAHEMTRRVAHEAASATFGIEALFGIGALTLGILSVVGLAPVTLTLIAMLSVGAATLFSGAAVSARMRVFARLCALPA